MLSATKDLPNFPPTLSVCTCDPFLPFPRPSKTSGPHDEVDILVHCDVQIFEWLFKYIHTSTGITTDVNVDTDAEVDMKVGEGEGEGGGEVEGEGAGEGEHDQDKHSDHVLCDDGRCEDDRPEDERFDEDVGANKCGNACLETGGRLHLEVRAKFPMTHASAVAPLSG